MQPAHPDSHAPALGLGFATAASGGVLGGSGLALGDIVWETTALFLVAAGIMVILAARMREVADTTPRPAPVEPPPLPDDILVPEPRPGRHRAGVTKRGPRLYRGNHRGRT